MPVLYIYAGRPDKSADIVHMPLEKYFMDNRPEFREMTTPSNVELAYLLNFGYLPCRRAGCLSHQYAKHSRCFALAREWKEAAHHCEEHRWQGAEPLRPVGELERP